MTADEAAALATVKGLAGANRIDLEPHARVRLRQRGAALADVRRALVTATGCRDQRADKTTAADWKVSGGVDTEGDELTCAVFIEGGVVVVTIF